MQEDLTHKSELSLLQNTLDALLELKKWFLLSAELKWQGKFPLNLVDDDIYAAYSEVEGQVGRLRMWRHRAAYLFEFETTEGKGFSTRRPLGKTVEEGYIDYEELLFNTWPYDGVGSKWEYDDCSTFQAELPEWHIIDPSYALTFEHFACETEKPLSNLSRDNKYDVLVEKVKKTIRNGLPKWQQCIIQWTYIKDLDEIIKDIETAIDNIKAEEPAGIRDQRNEVHEVIDEELEIDNPYKEEYYQFLTETANEVYRLVSDEHIYQQFQKNIKIFCEKNESFEKEYRQLEKTAEQNQVLYDYDKWKKNDSDGTMRPPLTYQMKEPPTGYEGYVWYNQYWGKPTRTPDLMEFLVNPLCRDIPYIIYWNQENATKVNNEERLICSYALLVSIHDMIVTERPIYTKNIDNGKWSKSTTWIRVLWDDYTDEAVFGMIESHVTFFEIKAWIKRVLEDVKADLAAKFDVDGGIGNGGELRKVHGNIKSPIFRLAVALDDFGRTVMSADNELKAICDLNIAPEHPDFFNQTTKLDTSKCLETMMIHMRLLDKLSEAQEPLYSRVGPESCEKLSEQITRAMDEIDKNIGCLLDITEYLCTVKKERFDNRHNYRKSVTANLNIIYDITQKLKDIVTSAETQKRTAVEPEEPSSNISGMTWQQAQNNAIKYVDKNGFPGIEKLIKEVGCSKGTMYKAIRNSRVLKNAKREYDGRRKSALKTLKAVGLSSKTLVKQEQTTEMSAELQVEIDSTDKDTMIAYMIKKVPSEKKDEAEEALKKKTVQEVRDIYKVFLETKDYDTRHKKA